MILVDSFLTGGTTVTSDCAWQSKASGSSRRGIRVTLLYLGTTLNTSVGTQQARLEHANRTVATVWTGSGSFSFLPADLETGPILAPEYGFFVRIQGRISISAKVAGADTKGGNGIRWWMTRRSQAGDRVLASGTIERGEAVSIPTATDAATLADLPVDRGDLVSLVVGLPWGTVTRCQQNVNGLGVLTQ